MRLLIFPIALILFGGGMVDWFLRPRRPDRRNKLSQDEVPGRDGIKSDD